MRTSHEGRGCCSSSVSRLTLLAMTAWLCALSIASGWAQQTQRESLDQFPKGEIEITGQEGSQRFHIWLADTTARSEQGLM